MEHAGPTHNAASDSMKDATGLRSPAGNGSSEDNLDGTLWMKGCVIGYCVFVPRMGSRRQNIELGPRLAQSNNKKSASHTLKEVSQQLLPWTQTIQGVFETFLPDADSKYIAVYETI